MSSFYKFKIGQTVTHSDIIAEFNKVSLEPDTNGVEVHLFEALVPTEGGCFLKTCRIF